MPSGRTRQFDVEEALDRALEVFWARGYEGATLPELTRAMGINRPSLYAAFGNKQQLFRKALDRYQTGPMAFLTEALRQPTARAVVEAIFSGFVRMQRDRDKARGCLIVSGALACGEEAETVRRTLAQLRQAIVTAFRERFERAVQDDDLPAGTDCATLARYIATVLNGLAVQSASGATEKELRLVAARAMQAWPAISLAPSVLRTVEWAEAGSTPTTVTAEQKKGIKKRHSGCPLMSPFLAARSSAIRRISFSAQVRSPRALKF
jgi:AcrR family transcriptional regulator